MDAFSPPPDEQAVVAAARAGDRAARERLFRDHWRSVWRCAHALTGDHATADDVTQDTFERAFAALDGFGERASFRTWVRVIATRRAVDILRRRSAAPLGDDVPAAEVDWPEDPGRRGDLRRAVAALEPDRRAVVVLVYWLDMSLSEAAQALGVPEGTVRSRLSRALTQLRDAMGVADAH